MAENDPFSTQDPSPSMGDLRLADDSSMRQWNAQQGMGAVKEADDQSMQPVLEQERNFAKQSLDPQNLYKIYPDLAAADQRAKGTSDSAAVMINLAYRLGKPVEEVSQNLQMYRSGYAQTKGWDVNAPDSVLKGKFQEEFKKEDDQQQSLQNLQAKAYQDAIASAGKGMSRNPLKAFSEWDASAFQGVPEDKKLQIFNKVWMSTQQTLTSPEGQKALQLVNTLNQNKEAAGIPGVGADQASALLSQGKDAPPAAEKIDPVQFLKGMPEAQQNKVLSIASQLLGSQQPEMGAGMKVAGGLGQAFAQGFTSWGAIGHLDDLVEAEQRLKAAQTPEDVSKAQDDIATIKLAQKIKQVDQSANMVDPGLSGVAGAAYKVGQGVVAMPGVLAPALVPVLGEFAFYKQAQAEDALRLMEQNPSMSAEEAKSRTTIASAAYGITMGRLAPLLGEAAPGLKGFILHTAQSTAIMQGAEAERIIGRQLQSMIDPSVSPDAEYGQEWLELLKATPYTFATLAAFGGALKLMNRGQAPDPNSFGELEKQAGNPRLLQYLGFDSETAQRIAAMPEGERVRELGGLWDTRTPEQKQDGIELARQDAASVNEVITSPDAPRVEQTPDGKFEVTTKQGEETHTATFETQEGANAAVQIALEDHIERTAPKQDGNDWTTATATDEIAVAEEPSLTKLHQADSISPDETQARRSLENTATGQESTLPIRTINASLASENFPARISIVGEQDLHQLADSPTFRLADELAGVFGKKIVAFRGDENSPNGIINSQGVLRDYIFLNKDNQNPHFQTLAHELLHHLELDAPELYKSLGREIAPLIKDWEGLHERYSKIGYENKDQHFDEVLADFLSDSFRTPDFLNKLRDQNPAVFKDFTTRVLEWLNSVIQRLKKWSINDHIRDIETARDMMAEGLHKYMIGDNTPIAPREHLQWWKKDVKATGERMRFVDDPIIAYLNENRIRSRTAQAKRNKSLGIEGGGEYDDQPALPPAHSREIFGGRQSIDQAHQELVDLGYLPEDSSVSDLWAYIDKASQNAIKQTKAEKAELARQREEKKADKELENLRQNDPVAYRKKLAEMEKGYEERKRMRDLIDNARTGYWETRFSLRDKEQDGFYSQLQRTIEGKMPNKASVEQIRAIIDPAKGSGVKPDEIKWSNLEGFLEGKKSVTKQEVLDYLKNEGAVKFEERNLSNSAADKHIAAIKDEIERKLTWDDEIQKLKGLLLITRDSEQRRIIQDKLLDRTEYLTGDLQEELKDAYQEHKESAQPKYSQYVLPGGENYREVVLTMPSKEAARYKELQSLAEKRELPAEFVSELVQLKEKQNGYISTHFTDIPNYVAHMRLDERKDASGRDGLFIEEIQSDRHQAGREKGYADEKPQTPFRVEEKPNGEFSVVDNRGVEIITAGTKEYAAKRADDFNREGVPEYMDASRKGGIPDAPFRKDWSVQMFKRALRDAIASGKEWIGWTSGETQAERYDLSKQVEKISAWRMDDERGLYDINVTDKSGKMHKFADQTADKLPDLVGKELAEKIVNDPEIANKGVHLTGLDLKVGGEGMKGFYDQILPKEVGKYVKKWGAKVEEGEVPATTSKKAEDLSDFELVQELKSDSNTAKIWKVEITPEMRESIQNEGQTRFSLKEDGNKVPPPLTFKDKARIAAGKVRDAIRDLPANSDFKREVLKWSARNQGSTNEIERVQKQIEKATPDAAKRDGITNWIEAGGDKTLLRERAAATTDAKLKAGYEAALNLTPDEIAIAKKVQHTFSVLETRAKKYGIDMGHRENYVPHVFEQEPQPPSGTSPKRLSEFFKFSQTRVFDSYFEGEQVTDKDGNPAPYKAQTKDIAKLLGLYMNDMNNAINSRRFVADLSKAKASDGRPVVSPRGGGTATTGEIGEKETHLVYPDLAKEGHEDYRIVDQPALHDWTFAGKDDLGANIMVKGDLAVHPEVAKHLENVLGTSAISKWLQAKTENPFLNAGKWVTDKVLKTQGIVKGTMLSFSPFHQVQEGIHALGHRVNPFTYIPKIDLRDPKQADAAAHGLMIAHDRLSQSLFMEGVGSNNSNLITMGLRKIGWGLTTAAAEKVDAYQHWLFSQYIPGLKYKTYEHILERNMERYKDDIAKGVASEWQVKVLSARQSNAAYGHLNYTEMGHNPTIRHALQLALLAPDFLEARSRFVGQAFKGLAGGKVGAEQLQALAFLAITQFVSATIQKVLNNGDPEFDHPFEMRVGNKYYGVRSVPEDIYKLFGNPAGFIGGRISPIFGRLLQEGVFGVNYRGERTSFGDAIADILAGVVPLPMQTLTRQWTTGGKSNPISPLEQILSSAGIQVHRYSPITKVYPLAHDWVKKNYPEDVQRGTYPVSKYQQLRYALEDNDAEKAHKEIERLVEGGMKRADIGKAFKLSVNHPFTGSKAHDKEFYNSLDEDDKQRFDAAVERRKEILRRFMSLGN